MVKVLPNNFTLFDSQRILSPAGEPLAIACSNELLFIAVEECTVEAYDLGTLEQLARFRTVSLVSQISYNSVGGCVVTLEKKHSASHGFVRVYFKWRGLSADKPMRILMASLQRSVPIQNRIAAEIVELPSDSGNSVSCLACCQCTGRIAVAMGSLVRVFYLEQDEQGFPHDSSSPSSHPHSSLPTPSVEILLDIQTHTPQLQMVSIVGDYLAFISTNEARVVKLSLFQSDSVPIPDYNVSGVKGGQSGGGVAVEGGENSNPSGGIVRDRNFLLWSPSAVWEAEKRAHMTSHDSPAHHDDIIAGDHLTSGDGHMTSTEGTPLVGTVHLKSIMQATSMKLTDRNTMEVLGPVEYVWGQPLTVSVNHAPGNGCQGAECRVLTMLYRRFSGDVVSGGSLGGGASLSQLSGLPRGQRASLPVRVQQGAGLRAEGGWDNLHSVRLIPTFTPSPGGE